jgi:hypothetical protein
MGCSSVNVDAELQLLTAAAGLPRKRPSSEEMRGS